MCVCVNVCGGLMCVRVCLYVCYVMLCYVQGKKFVVNDHLFEYCITGSSSFLCYPVSHSPLSYFSYYFVNPYMPNCTYPALTLIIYLPTYSPLSPSYHYPSHPTHFTTHPTTTATTTPLTRPTSVSRC